MNNGYFVTGTDTGAGKTWATLALMHYFQKQGKTVAGMKPVASGCRWNNGRWFNDDALLMQAHASIEIPYDWVNPYAYEQPISPHLAGKHDPVNLEQIKVKFQGISQRADIVLVEGAGGWLAPINGEQTISDLAKTLALPVILVVGVRLGCINHALLTSQAIVKTSLNFVGWLAVCLDAEMFAVNDNIAYLNHNLNAPLIGVLPFSPQGGFDKLSEHISW